MFIIMKITKIIFPLFILLALSLTACGDDNKTDKQTKKVAIVQMVDNTSFEEIRKGFITQLRAHGYDESEMTFYIKDAQGDASVLNTIAQEVTSGEYDVVAAIATQAAQALVNMDSNLPTFFMCVIDPLGARLTTSLEKPDRNATGTSNHVPIIETFEMAKKITPDVKTFGLLYTPAEANAVSVINAVKEYFDATGIPYKEAIIANAAEAQQAAQSLVGSVDAIYVPVDATAQSAMPSIAEVVREAGIPLYCSSIANVVSGAFATLSTPEIVLGEVAADMVHNHLNGTAIVDIPMQVVPATEIVINEKTANSLGITIPKELGAKLIKAN